MEASSCSTSVRAVPALEGSRHAARAATQQRSIHATLQQPRDGRLAIARLPPCSPGGCPDLPCYRRRLAARRAGLPPRPARQPAPASPADAQLPSQAFMRQDRVSRIVRQDRAPTPTARSTSAAGVEPPALPCLCALHQRPGQSKTQRRATRRKPRGGSQQSCKKQKL